MRWTLAIALLALALLPGGFALADKGKDFWDGRPEFTPGEHMGYFLWHDSEGWHLRWTTKEKKHRFHGTITCDDAFKGVSLVSKDDRKDMLDREGRDTITFDTRVAGGKDGLDFRLSAKTGKVTFDLMIDGARVEPNRVKIGRNKRLPKSVPFTFDR